MAHFMESCMRVTLFILNFIFFCIGGAGIGLGVWSKVNPGANHMMFGISRYETFPIVLIVLGCLVLLISLFGFCGAIKMSKSCLLVYTGLLILMLLVEVGLTIAGYFLKQKLSKAVDETAKKHIKNDYQEMKVVKDLVDYVQKSMKCCGVSNHTDWLDSKWRKQANNTGLAVPKSCCVKTTDDSKCNAADDKGNILDPSKIYTKGCNKSFKDMVHKYMRVILIAAICIALIQLFGVIMGCCLMSSIRSK